MRMSASWFGSWTHRIQGRGAIDPRPESGLPSNRHPDRIECAVVLRAVKVWPGKGGAYGKVGATANLESFCARRLCNTAGRGEETGFQIEQRNRSRKIAARKPLDKKRPHTRGACIDPHGFDAGKLIKGKKRHILVDTLGLLLHAIVHSAGIQDRDGGIMLLATLFGQFPFIEKLFADSAYQGPIFGNALAKILPGLETEIVKRSDQAKGFVRLPKRWIVERTIAWLNRCRRLAKDWENLNRNALAFLKLASIRLMLRKLCNP